MSIETSELAGRLVRYGDLIPCKTAFIDAHTPGSDQKENFTIIGGGVSESPDQHVHIAIPHGFNIGAAGQPPKCRNSLHDHNLPRFSSYYLDVGGFFGAGGVMREKLYLSRAISLIYLLVYFGALKI